MVKKMRAELFFEPALSEEEIKAIRDIAVVRGIRMVVLAEAPKPEGVEINSTVCYELDRSTVGLNLVIAEVRKPMHSATPVGTLDSLRHWQGSVLGTNHKLKSDFQPDTLIGEMAGQISA